MAGQQSKTQDWMPAELCLTLPGAQWLMGPTNDGASMGLAVVAAGNSQKHWQMECSADNTWHPTAVLFLL